MIENNGVQLSTNLFGCSSDSSDTIILLPNGVDNMVNWNNQKEVKEYHKLYMRKNGCRYRKKYREKIRRCMEEYHKDNKEYLNKKSLKYYYENKKCCLKRNKLWKKNNPEKNKIHQRKSLKKYRIRYPEKIREGERRWRNDNKERVKQYGRKHYHIYKGDINHKLSYNLRGKMYKAIKRNSKSKRTKELIGCSIEDLKQHLESKFTFGMNWKNYGFGWHIDHIKPCSSFDLSKPEEQEKCFHYTNLQPLWATENLSKHNTIEIIKNANNIQHN